MRSLTTNIYSDKTSLEIFFHHSNNFIEAEYKGLSSAVMIFKSIKLEKSAMSEMFSLISSENDCTTLFEKIKKLKEAKKVYRIR